MIERGSTVPSSMPRRVDSEPAAMLRTTTSSGMISTSRISCSRMLRRLMKWVGMPIRLRWLKMCSEMRLLRTPLPSIDFHLLLVERGGVVLEELDEGAGFRTFEQDLGLAFINAPTTVHGHIPWFEDVHITVGSEEFLAVSKPTADSKLRDRRSGRPYSIGSTLTIAGSGWLPCAAGVGSGSALI